MKPPKPTAAQGKGSKAPKRPFDIDVAIERLREAVAPYPKAALFELAGEGHTSVFEILVACIISIRSKKETFRGLSHEGLLQLRAVQHPGADGRSQPGPPGGADRALGSP